MYVLGLFDNPMEDLGLLDKERRVFKKHMSALMKNEVHFKYEDYEGNSLKDLMKFIDDNKDTINWFHFSGHHDEKGGIRVYDGNFSTLADQLLRCKNLKGIFINGCDSKKTLDKLSKKVPICIGTTKPVYDGIATEFSEMFYEKMKDVRDWEKYEEYFEAFEGTKKQISNLNEEGNIKNVNTKVRGGGNQEKFELEDDFYFISPKNDSGKKIFDDIKARGIKTETDFKFNIKLTRGLIDALDEKNEIKDFLSNNLNIGNKKNWELWPDNLMEAQERLNDSFVWVIGESLRRLFAIGRGKTNMQKRYNDYIKNCRNTHRISMLLINYIFISKLWDEKRKNSGLDTDKDLIKTFFSSNRVLTLVELRNLFLLLLEIFETNDLDFPMERRHLGDLTEFLNADSDFNKAASYLENLSQSLDSGGYDQSHCLEAELSLTTFLTGLKFLGNYNYEMLTIKRIEYEAWRNSDGRYIKDITVLSKKKNSEDNKAGANADIQIDTSTDLEIIDSDIKRFYLYSKVPSPAYSVYFRNNKKAVSLLPFLLDYNALKNEPGIQLYFYEFWNGGSGIRYKSIHGEKHKIIDFKDADATKLKDIKDEVAKNNLRNTIRIDLVTKQFEEAMSTLLGPGYKIRSKESEMVPENYDNI